jgi:hypothetical protein
MWVLRVRDRGRELSTHLVEGLDDARELRRVYEQMGYPVDKIVIEPAEESKEKAA